MYIHDLFPEFSTRQSHHLFKENKLFWGEELRFKLLNRKIYIFKIKIVQKNKTRKQYFSNT